MIQKKLSECIAGLSWTRKVGDGDPVIQNITFDSRQVVSNTLFVALRGTQIDGHNFIADAVSKGANAIVCEVLPEKTIPEVCYLVVEDSHSALGQIAGQFYEYPSSHLNLVGVTGTNGKTTIATLLYHTAKSLGYKAGLCSTVVNYVDEEKVDATHTTPDVVTLNRLMYEMVQADCQYCFMEVSSHAIDQKRIEGLSFKGGIFTNITHEHLDYHKTFDEYIRVKKSFFDNLPESAFALTNLDDKHGRVIVQNTVAEKKSFSLREMASYRAKIVENSFEGMQLSIDGEEFWTPFVGRFNASNLLAVYGAGCELGWDKQDLLVAMSSLKPVSGRFEIIRSAGGITGIVDYAHTPDALRNVLEAINKIRRPGQSLITVVGAGGNRDTTKRPVMASEAVKNSSKVILTSDNPRNEDPKTIIDQMMEGVSFAERIKVLTIPDRREAIRTACSIARSGDIVLVAGKGHETYQEVNGRRSHFDDREVIKEFFEQQQS
ncbi:UDP-N-acetylmuramoyl-L-alanyl-D-glutamate--2,6-diaminopimelate ligase [Thermophagus sp. OGC60D27]|uniref:UDP-N-acetylmuramoyl-L-alanyl-D-glutamate--2, 6-diaminopimelate ligase n=1 Tax=Thermophagus sp. OGC60D27 TaxID=3458415 RepID=UPI0040376E99